MYRCTYTLYKTSLNSSLGSFFTLHMQTCYTIQSLPLNVYVQYYETLISVQI
jgi:hypothetical protein